MKIKEVIKSQYLASLEMLHQAIVMCPEALWYDQDYKNRFWHVSYHALFYTHLYLQPSEEDFVPWSKHRDQYQFMGSLPWPPHKEPDIGEPYSVEEVLEYYRVTKGQVVEKVLSLDLEAESGFNWLPFNKMELQFYNIRHLMHHTGELCERLGRVGEIEVNWIGMKRE
jgi:hypothetical protein